jgi:hypothetical protein
MILGLLKAASIAQLCVVHRGLGQFGLNLNTTVQPFAWRAYGKMYTQTENPCRNRGQSGWVSNLNSGQHKLKEQYFCLVHNAGCTSSLVSHDTCVRRVCYVQHEDRLDFHSPAGSLMFWNNSHTSLHTYHLLYRRIKPSVNNGSHAGTSLNVSESTWFGLGSLDMCVALLLAWLHVSRKCSKSSKWVLTTEAIITGWRLPYQPAMNWQSNRMNFLSVKSIAVLSGGPLFQFRS